MIWVSELKCNNWYSQISVKKKPKAFWNKIAFVRVLSQFCGAETEYIDYLLFMVYFGNYIEKCKVTDIYVINWSLEILYFFGETDVKKKVWTIMGSFSSCFAEAKPANPFCCLGKLSKGLWGACIWEMAPLICSAGNQTRDGKILGLWHLHWNMES